MKPLHPITAPGLTEHLTVTLDEAGASVATLSVLWPDGSTATAEGMAGPQGRLTYELAVPSGMPPGSAEVSLQATALKKSVVARMDVLERENYEALDRLAASIPVEKPLRILYLGDSLTAQQAGSNHVDKVRFWFEKHHPGKTTFRNAAVGGDTIERVWQRFQHLLDPAFRKTRGQETYDAIFSFQPDVVLIFLGHNDTKASNRTGFKEPYVSFDVQEKSFRSVIGLLKEKTDAQLVLVSSTSSVDEICRRRAEPYAKEGSPPRNRFGIPELLERYNELVARLSREYGLDYVDVYTPTRDHPDKANLFNPKDGVHLSPEGNRFMATLFLKYFAGPNRIFGPGPVATTTPIGLKGDFDSKTPVSRSISRP